MGLGVQQEAVVEGGRDPRDPCRLRIDWVEWRRAPTDHDRAVSPTPKASGDLDVRLFGGQGLDP